MEYCYGTKKEQAGDKHKDLKSAEERNQCPHFHRDGRKRAQWSLRLGEFDPETLQRGSPRVVSWLDLLCVAGLNRYAHAERRGLWCEF